MNWEHVNKMETEEIPSMQFPDGEKLAALGIFYLIQRKVKAVSTWVLHLSFVIILVGAFITHVNGKQGMMHLRIGEPSDIYFSNNPAEGIQQRKLPFTLSLQKFNIHLYEGTNVVRDYSSQFLVTDHYEMEEAKVSLNKIYTHGSYRFASSLVPSGQT